MGTKNEFGSISTGNIIGTGIAIGPNAVANVTVNQIVQGLGSLPTQYDAPVRNFLDHYLGTASRPAPFGGRSAELTRLDTWLDDEESPPYALLTAPAGRGKSALIAHWIAHLKSRSDLAVVFFPISMRFGSNRSTTFMPALYARLAFLHGITAQRSADVDEYRNVFMDLLLKPLPDSRRTLVVVDGLDEANMSEVWSGLFPAVPPPHLRVLSAARTFERNPDWLTRLDWNAPQKAVTFPLAGLSTEGVREILAHMGHPLADLAAEFNIVHKLHELSEGDPLLIGLYIEALRSLGPDPAILTPDDLLAVEPGYRAYFDLCFDQQEAILIMRGQTDRKAVDVLLRLSAVALGPLNRVDVMKAAPTTFDSLQAVDRAAQAIERLIIGDGVHQGYIFSHSKLNQYFLENRLTSAEIDSSRNQLLTYCCAAYRDLETGELLPANVSRYVLQNYAAHLQLAGASLDKLKGLLNPIWLVAWEKLTGGIQGFLDDIDRVWKEAYRIGQSDLRSSGQVSNLDTLAKCALAWSSLASRSEAMPHGLPAALHICGLRDFVSAFDMASRFASNPKRILAYLSFLTQPSQEKNRMLSEIQVSLICNRILDELMTLDEAHFYWSYGLHSFTSDYPEFVGRCLADLSHSGHDFNVADLNRMLLAAGLLRSNLWRAYTLSHLISVVTDPDARLDCVSKLLGAIYIARRDDKFQELEYAIFETVAIRPDFDLIKKAIVVSSSASGDEFSDAEACKSFLANLAQHIKLEDSYSYITMCRDLLNEQDFVTAVSHLAPRMSIEAAKLAFEVLKPMLQSTSWRYFRHTLHENPIIALILVAHFCIDQGIRKAILEKVDTLLPFTVDYDREKEIRVLFDFVSGRIVDNDLAELAKNGAFEQDLLYEEILPCLGSNTTKQLILRTSQKTDVGPYGQKIRTSPYWLAAIGRCLEENDLAIVLEFASQGISFPEKGGRLNAIGVVGERIPPGLHSQTIEFIIQGQAIAGCLEGHRFALQSMSAVLSADDLCRFCDDPDSWHLSEIATKFRPDVVENTINKVLADDRTKQFPSRSQALVILALCLKNTQIRDNLLEIALQQRLNVGDLFVRHRIIDALSHNLAGRDLRLLRRRLHQQARIQATMAQDSTDIRTLLQVAEYLPFADRYKYDLWAIGYAMRSAGQDAEFKGWKRFLNIPFQHASAIWVAATKPLNSAHDISNLQHETAPAALLASEEIQDSALELPAEIFSLEMLVTDINETVVGQLVTAYHRLFRRLVEIAPSRSVRSVDEGSMKWSIRHKGKGIWQSLRPDLFPEAMAALSTFGADQDAESTYEARAVVLILLLPGLAAYAPQLLPTVSTLVNEIITGNWNFPAWYRASVLRNLLFYMDNDARRELLPKIMAGITELNGFERVEVSRSIVLGDFLEYAPDSLLGIVAELLVERPPTRIREQNDCQSTLMAFVSRAANNSAILRQVWPLIERLDDRNFLEFSSTAAYIADHEVLANIILLATKQSRWHKTLYAPILSRCSKLPKLEAYAVLNDVLRGLRTRSRREFLYHLALLSGLVSELGTASTGYQLVNSILDVTEWWP